MMASTSPLFVRIDTSLKDRAEGILSQLGISPSSAVQMFYSQIILKQGIPFDLRLSPPMPTAIGGMTRSELDMELQKGVDSMKSGIAYSADEVDELLAGEFGI